METTKRFLITVLVPGVFATLPTCGGGGGRHNSGEAEAEGDGGQEAEAEGGGPHLLDQCDPIHVHSRCIGEDVIATCQVESGQYQLLYDSNCSGNTPRCYEAIASSSVSATCVCREGMRVCSSGCTGVCHIGRGCSNEYPSWPSCVAECSGIAYHAVQDCNSECSSSESGQASCTSSGSGANPEAGVGSDAGTDPVRARCGDGRCDGDETCSSCSDDCGVCPVAGPCATDGTCSGWTTVGSCWCDDICSHTPRCRDACSWCGDCDAPACP